MRRLLAAALLALPYPAIPHQAETYLCIVVVVYPLNKTQRPVSVQKPDTVCDDDSQELALKRALVILETDRKR